MQKNQGLGGRDWQPALSPKVELTLVDAVQAPQIDESVNEGVKIGDGLLIAEFGALNA